MDWFGQMRKIWSRLPGTQRVFLVGVILALGIVIVLTSVWAMREEYTILYADLDPSAASEIVEGLQSRAIKYKLEDAGRTITVPKSDVYDARLSLASSGLPQGSGSGYEILDTNKMGWTDFVQKLQYRRALEGEIARTIEALDEIVQARVHIVIPEPSLFQEDEKPTTASIVVKLRSGASLREPQVQGIVHLVAAGVEGLQPDNVTVLDTHGRLVSRPTDEDGILGVTGDQIYLTRKVEEGLVQKAETALERVLGSNKAVVRVSADLDFERVETTSETFDAENPVVRSEQRSEGTSAEAGTNEQSTTNYEISKTIRRIVETPGGVQRLSVSVFVDGTYKTDAEGIREYVPRTAEEMEKLSDLIKAAIGFDQERGDVLSVENIGFDDTEMNRTLLEMEKSHRLDMIQKIGSVAVSLLLAVGTLLVMIRILKRAAIVTGPGRAAGSDLEEDEEMITPEARKARDAQEIRLKRKVDEIQANNSADEVARVIRTWMRAQ